MAPAAVRLRSIFVQGFKSFAKATTIEFMDGLTCIVGENGSGKSNLLDAISFAIGETPANLRVKEISELACNGCRKTQVELVFLVRHRDENDGAPTSTSSSSLSLPAASSPKASTRVQEVRLGSCIVEGTRFYLLNGSRVPKHRFDEVVVSELSLHTGQAHTLWRISQHEIATKIALGPRQLFDVLCQASGTKVFNARREEARTAIAKFRKQLATASTNIATLSTELEAERSFVAVEAREVQLKEALSDAIPEEKEGLEQRLHRAELQCFDAQHAELERQLGESSARRKELSRRIAEVRDKLNQLESRRGGGDDEDTTEDDTTTVSARIQRDLSAATTRAMELTAQMGEVRRAVAALKKHSVALGELAVRYKLLTTVTMPFLEDQRSRLFAQRRRLTAPGGSGEAEGGSASLTQQREALEQGILGLRERLDTLTQDLQFHESLASNLKEQHAASKVWVRELQVTMEGVDASINTHWQGLSLSTAGPRKRAEQPSPAQCSDAPRLDAWNTEVVKAAQERHHQVRRTIDRGMLARAQSLARSLGSSLWFGDGDVERLQQAATDHDHDHDHDNTADGPRRRDPRQPGLGSSGRFIFELIELKDPRYEHVMSEVLGSSMGILVVERTEHAMEAVQHSRAHRRVLRVWSLDRIDSPRGSVAARHAKRVGALCKRFPGSIIDPLTLLESTTTATATTTTTSASQPMVEFQVAVIKALGNWVIIADDSFAAQALEAGCKAISMAGNKHTSTTVTGGYKKGSGSSGRGGAAASGASKVAQANELAAILHSVRGGLSELSAVKQLGKLAEAVANKARLLKEHAQQQDASSAGGSPQELYEKLQAATLEVTARRQIRDACAEEREQLQATLDDLVCGGMTAPKSKGGSGGIEDDMETVTAKLTQVGGDIQSVVERMQGIVEAIQDETSGFTSTVVADDDGDSSNTNSPLLLDGAEANPAEVLACCSSAMAQSADLVKALQATLFASATECTAAEQERACLAEAQEKRRKEQQARMEQAHDLRRELQDMKRNATQARQHEATLQRCREDVCKGRSAVARKVACDTEGGEDDAMAAATALLPEAEALAHVTELKEQLVQVEARANQVRSELKKLRSSKRGFSSATSRTNLAAIDAKERVVAGLHEALDSVTVAIEHLERGTQDALALMKQANEQCFTRANEVFGRMVAQLLPGKQGRMCLSGDTLEDGIVLRYRSANASASVNAMAGSHAHSPDKSVRELSGGQQSLVGLAITLALASIQQLPLYVLDEVDAPLDQLNQGVAARYVKHALEGSQVVCVSHHKALQQAADQHITLLRRDNSTVVVGD